MDPTGSIIWNCSGNHISKGLFKHLENNVRLWVSGVWSSMTWIRYGLEISGSIFILFYFVYRHAEQWWYPPQERQLNLWGKELLCQNVSLHTLKDNLMDVFCTIMNSICFTPQSEWKDQLINYNKQPLNGHCKKILSSLTLLELFMWITNDHPDLWSSLHLPQKVVGDLVPIDVVSIICLSFFFFSLDFWHPSSVLCFCHSS